MRTILRPQWLLDGTGGPVQGDHALVMAGEHIEAVIPARDVVAQEGDTVIDLPQMTLLPGLINNHVHLVLPGDNTPFTPWIDLQSDAALATRAAHNLRSALRSGVTAVRDCGGRHTVVLDVREAQAIGLVEGARVLACGWTITITGGHTRHFGGEVDGVIGLRQMVRKLVSAGADYIKVMASGGGTPGTFAQFPSFSVEELQAIVETAHGFGKLVAAHCTCAAAIVNAVEARVDLIEHAMFYRDDPIPQFDPNVAERIADAGIPVTPTLQVDRDMSEILPEGSERSLWQRRNQVHREGVRAMHRMGVRLLAGSDAGWRATAFDSFWKELDELVACGLTPTEAIHAATGATSRALGCSDRMGTVQAGRLADLLVVDGNLASDIRRLQHVRAVYQGGAAVFSSLRSPRPA